VKLVKLVILALLIYVGIVAAFEGLLGYFQPSGGDTLVITTTSPDGEKSDRVLSRLELDGKLYVAANHWPRAWYAHALANPEVEVTVGDQTGDYLAVPVSEQEHARLEAERGVPLLFRILTGFPPRYFVRLDPRGEDLPESAPGA
jgi:hypothetical protein